MEYSAFRQLSFELLSIKAELPEGSSAF